MKLLISPKDSFQKFFLTGVSYFWQEVNCYCIRFEDGSIRTYPMIHIWYIETVFEETEDDEKK